MASIPIFPAPHKSIFNPRDLLILELVPLLLCPMRKTGLPKGNFVQWFGFVHLWYRLAEVQNFVEEGVKN